ncbi:MAG: glycosyltransferase [Candidatus Aenigmarchaeota archaeon]|nr:glycosyltransferase [Candidatus Aenigmarchaeota archaeon]
MDLFFHEASLLLFNSVLIPVALFSAAFYLLAVLGIRHRTPARYQGVAVKQWPSVTIQIPTKNEQVAIRCAEHCLRFDYPGRFQIIIGDDSTDSEVSRAIDAFARQHPNVTVTRRGSTFGYKPGNLNHMLQFSKGEIIAIFDSDFLPPTDFLTRIVKPFVADEKVACVQAKWDYLNIGQTRVSRFASSILMVYHHLLAPINERLGVSLLFGSAEAVRASALRELGGWKDWSMTEDVEFTLRALRAGYKSVYLSDLSVPGEVPFNLRGLSKQQKRWAYGNAKAFFDNSRWILFGGRFSLLQKAALLFTLVGYISAPFLVVFMLLGIVTWFTGTPGVIDVAKFSLTTGQIFLINSGFLAAALVALHREKRARMIISVVGASLTYGIWVSISVFDGLMKALARKKMQWYMIRKAGNESLTLPSA